tara:strand:+ start:3029 stop:4321 length:1293 start_codon:yes stop_codon:yes gene_type:complete
MPSHSTIAGDPIGSTEDSGVSKVLTGVVATGALGSLTSTGLFTGTIGSVAATGALGSISAAGPGTFAVTAVSASTSIAALTFNGKANIASPAVTASTSINATTGTGGATGSLTSLSVTGSAFGDVEELQSHNYTVTVANIGGVNKFLIDGVEAAELTLVKGLTYVFDVSDSSNSGHPFRFKDVYGNAYTTGVTTSGTEGQTGATVTLELATTGLMPYRYYCTLHGNGMGNIIRSVESTTNFAVTVSNVGGVNVFVLNGVNTPTLQLLKGVTYVFDVSDNTVSGHPLAFKNGSSSYTSGVTVSGTAGNSGATVTFAVPTNAPSQGLRYYCTTHGNAMGNTITTSSNSASLFVTGPATFSMTSVLGTFSQTLPTVTGPATFTIGSTTASTSLNATSATGVVFPFEDFADQFNRNRTVVIRPVNTHNVVYITS